MKRNSPCVQVCVVNPGDSHCTGCMRTLQEIRDWRKMTEEERDDVMQACKIRQFMVQYGASTTKVFEKTSTQKEDN